MMFSLFVRLARQTALRSNTAIRGDTATRTLMRSRVTGSGSWAPLGSHIPSPSQSCRQTVQLRGLTTQQASDGSKKQEEGPPPEDYYDGNKIAEHLEYLEEMIDKTAGLKEKMEELRERKAQAVAKAAAGGGKWTETKEIDALFEDAARQKADIAAHFDQFRDRMLSARKTMVYNYAVDGPDGESDVHLEEEMVEIEHIIDDAAVLEDREHIDHQHEEQARMGKEVAEEPIV